MIFRRRRQQREDINDARRIAAKHLQVAKQMAEQTEKLGADLHQTRERNHFGESLAIAYQTRKQP